MNISDIITVLFTIMIEFDNLKDLHEFIAEHALAVVYFYAGWAGPCKTFGPQLYCLLGNNVRQCP
jgi:hypothetical protein